MTPAPPTGRLAAPEVDAPPVGTSAGIGTGATVTGQFHPAVRFALGLGILLAFAGLGQAVVTLTRLPLPGSVVGLVLLWAALGLRLIRLHWLADAADGLLGLLGLLFVPATVGFLQYLSAGAAWFWWVLVMTAGLLVGGAVAGLTAARLVRA